MSLLPDTHGRVPFAVLGVFLVVGSAVTSGIITGLEKERSAEIPLSLATTALEYAIKNVEADMSRLLAYSGLQALKKVGETPVISSTLSTRAAKKYADFNEDGHFDSEDVKDKKIDTQQEIMMFNRNWARNMARCYFNRYLNATFQQPMYEGEEYALTIYDPGGNGAVDDWRDVTFHKISMQVDRAAHIDLLVTEDNTSYDTYWTAEVESLGLEIEHMASGERWVKWLNISCLIPSRLPLLMGLTHTYQKSVSGSTSPFMGLVTAMGAGYTEVRSLLQYAGKYDWVKNVVDNRWLQYVANTALLGIQYLVFNSIDPVALAQLALHVNDLVSKGTPYDTGTLSDIITHTISLPIDHRENIFKTLGRENESAASAALNELTTGGNGSRASADVWDLSRQILNETQTIYYYYNRSAGFCNQTTWKGYSFTENDCTYRLSLQEGDPDNDTTGSQPCFTRRYSDRVNRSILQKIREEINRTYSANFSTRVQKTKRSEGYSPPLNGNWRLLSVGEWKLVDSKATSGVLKEGDLPTVLPYTEKWILSWERKERWEQEECHQEKRGGKNVTVCRWVPRNVTHYYNESAAFELNAHPWYPDIEDVFYQKEVLGMPPHEGGPYTDDNLQFLLEEYVDKYFTKLRDRYTDVTVGCGRNTSAMLDERWWKNNTPKEGAQGRVRIAWVEREALAALWNITQLIKEDQQVYSDTAPMFYSDEPSAANLSVLEKTQKAVKDEFQRHKERYAGGAHYRSDSRYKSAAARVIAATRKWFVQEVEQRLQKSCRSRVEEKIDAQLEHHAEDGGLSYEGYRRHSDMHQSGIDHLTSIRFGSQMNLDNGRWQENVTLGVSTVPDYFDVDATPSREQDWWFNVKNVCLFGPTGLPVLPTPVTPWVVTLNAWYIQVNGRWDSFTVLDSSDETLPHALFGHCSQTYCRQKEVVYDRVCHPYAPDSERMLGRNKPLCFECETMSLGIVPPGKVPIGDFGRIVESDCTGNETKR